MTLNSLELVAWEIDVKVLLYFKKLSGYVVHSQVTKYYPSVPPEQTI